MNSLINLTLLVVITTCSVMQSYSQNCKGTLVINTDRENSLIYLDNVLIGKGNIELKLDAGFYKISTKENNKIWERNTLAQSVIINQCNHKILNFYFNKGFYLQTEPQDVAVFSKDSLIGYTPLYLTANKVELKKPGYKSKYISLEEYKRNPAKAGTLDYVGMIKETSFYERDLFKILLAGIIVLGGTTAYFKLKADKKFEEYEITGDQALLDQTEKYDLISGITFTALQINFGVLIYFFLNE